MPPHSNNTDVISCTSGASLADTVSTFLQKLNHFTNPICVHTLQPLVLPTTCTLMLLNNQEQISNIMCTSNH